MARDNSTSVCSWDVRKNKNIKTANAAANVQASSSCTSFFSYVRLLPSFQCNEKCNFFLMNEKEWTAQKNSKKEFKLYKIKTCCLDFLCCCCFHLLVAVFFFFAKPFYV